MSKIAILIGIYSYIIYFLGISRLLYFQNILALTIGYFIFCLILLFRSKQKIYNSNIFKDKIKLLLLGLITIQVIIYSIGTIAPEIGFDALWYHLTIPKIFIANQMIFHIPGNLFYYSDMPKLIDVLYIPALLFGNEITAKLIHFSFGIFSMFALYNLSRKFLSDRLSVLSVIVLTSNLVFAWELNTSYVDLGWLFFEILSLTYFIEFIKHKTFKNILFLGIFVGLSISVKLSALFGIVMYLVLLSGIFYFQKISFKQSFKYLSLFIVISTTVVSPYLIFSFLNTGNPFYPLFVKSIVFTHTFDLFSFLRVWIVDSDPVNIIYIIIFPLIPFVFRKINFASKIIVFYCLLSLFSWYLIGQIGGSRYLLPYLAGFSILVVIVYKNIQQKSLQNTLIILIILIAIFTAGYRFAANFKYIPYVLGFETKNQFLIRHLNFSFGDFYDTDNFFKNNVSQGDTVLMVGFHNLYYADFNFIDYSYLKKGDSFKYIAVQNTLLPKEFSSWKLIHTNQLTNVKIYTNNKVWVY